MLDDYITLKIIDFYARSSVKKSFQEIIEIFSRDLLDLNKLSQGVIRFFPQLPSTRWLL